MAKPARTRKNRSVRKLNVEQLEARRVFAGFVFESAIVIGNDSVGVVAETSAVDEVGNQYVGGFFYTGSMDFDRSRSHPGDADILVAQGARDGFIAKYGPTGEFIWARRMGGNSEGSDSVTGLALDSSGHVYAAGRFSGIADFGDSNLESTEGQDVFVTKLDAAGNFLWARSYGEGVNDSVGGFQLTTNGNLILCVGRKTVLQISPDGETNWEQKFESPLPANLIEDTEGNYVMSGFFSGTVDFDPGPATHLVTSQSPTSDAFILKLNQQGEFISITTLGVDASGDPDAFVKGTLILGKDGSYAFFGSYQGQPDIDPGSGTHFLPLATKKEFFIARFSMEGELLGIKTFSQITQPYGFGLSPIGNGYAARMLISGIGAMFSPRPGETYSSIDGSIDSVVVLMDDELNITNTYGFSGYGTQFIDSVKSDTEGNIYFTGWSSTSYVGFEDYDLNSGTSFNVSNPAWMDGFLIKMRMRAPGEQVVLFEDSFEDKFNVGEWAGKWVEDSQNDWYRSSQRATNGSYSADVDGSATNATLTTANGIDLTGLDSAQLTFDWLIERGFDKGEFLALDISTDGGATWIQDVRRLNGDVSPENVWRTETVDMTPYMTANTKIRFRSTVSDPDEDANVDNVLITGIVSGPNASPIANAGGGYVTNEGSSILLNAAASSDPDGSIVSYAWDLDLDGQYDDATGVSPSFSTTNSGSFTIGLLVTDNRGATSTTTTTVVVNNVAPTANVGKDLTGSVNQAIQLSASASSDPGNDIVSYLWDLNNDGIFGDATGSQATFTSAIAGVFAVGLQVIDADGAIGHDSLTITISAAPVLSTKFYVVDDAGSDRTYEYTSNGTSVENYSLGSGNTAPRGAASTVAGDKVWVVDANKRVYIYDAAGTLLGSWAAGSLVSNATIEGITTNGTDVWLVDARQDRVYRYTGAATRLSGSQNAASSFALNSGNRDPKDLVTDGSHIWVVNSTTTDRVFKYTVAGSLVGNWSIDTANSSPTGITLDPSGASQSLWIVDNGTDRVYEYTNARARSSGSQSAANSFALGAGNSNPQGIADPPVAPVNHRSVAAPLVIGSWSMQPEQRPAEGSQRYAAVDRAMSSGLLDYLSVQPSQSPASRVSAPPFAVEQYAWSEYATDIEKDEWDDALSQAIDELVVGAK